MHIYIRELIALYQTSQKLKISQDVIITLAQRALTLVDSKDFQPRICPTILMLCKNHNLTWGEISILHHGVRSAITTHHANFDCRTLSTILSTLASLGFTWLENDLTKDLLLKRAFTTIKNFNEQDISMTLHALAQLDALDERMIKKSCGVLSKMIDNLSNKSCVKLHTSFTHYCLDNKKKWSHIIKNLPQGASDAIIERSQHMLVNSVGISLFQQEVTKILASRKNQIKLEEEALIHCMVVDIYLPQYRAVIEVNGPFHFLENGEFNPRSKYKRKLLERLKYKVIDINHYVWDKLHNPQAKKIYLDNLLHFHLGIKPTIPWTPLHTTRQDTNKNYLPAKAKTPTHRKHKII